MLWTPATSPTSRDQRLGTALDLSSIYFFDPSCWPSTTTSVTLAFTLVKVWYQKLTVRLDAATMQYFVKTFLWLGVLQWPSAIQIKHCVFCWLMYLMFGLFSPFITLILKTALLKENSEVNHRESLFLNMLKLWITLEKANLSFQFNSSFRSPVFINFFSSTWFFFAREFVWPSWRNCATLNVHIHDL